MSAYFIFHNRITDRAKMADYIQKALVTLAPYNVEVLVADENCSVIEGQTEFPRMVVIKFNSRADAERWYNSPEYAAVRPLRLEATEGFGVLANGYGA